MGLVHIDIQIVVTEEDIRQGIKKSPEFCPIAQSVRRDFRPKRVVVGKQPFIITEQNQHFDILLTWPMIWFMNAFDNGEPVKPTVFTTSMSLL